MRKYFIWALALPDKLVLNAATLGPIGFKTKAPGTLGSIVGIFWYIVAFHHLAPFEYLLLLLLSAYVSMAICDQAEIRMKMRDPGVIILDEFVAIPFCFIGLFDPAQYGITLLWPWLLAGFLLFRFFDILKPLGINKLQKMEGGVGVVADDLGAALITCAMLHGIAMYVA